MNINGQNIVNIAVPLFNNGLGQVKISLESCRSLSCKAGNAHTVAAVGSDFKFNAGVVITESLVNIHSERFIAIIASTKMPSGVAYGKSFLGKAQLVKGTEHTV